MSNNLIIKVIQHGNDYDIITPDGEVMNTTIDRLVEQTVRNAFGEGAEIDLVNADEIPTGPAPVESIAGPVLPSQE